MLATLLTAAARVGQTTAASPLANLVDNVPDLRHEEMTPLVAAPDVEKAASTLEQPYPILSENLTKSPKQQFGETSKFFFALGGVGLFLLGLILHVIYVRYKQHHAKCCIFTL